MSDIETGFTTLRAADGVSIGAYRARPRGTARAGLVAVQEIFGVNSHIRAVADGYAARGYDVIAPAFFDRIEPNVELGYDETGIARGRAFAAQLGFDRPLLDVAAASGMLSPSPVGIVGYCWGGSLAYLAAARIEGLRAAVGYYGSAIAKHVDEAPRVPVLLHFGRLDRGIPLTDVTCIQSQHPALEVHLYDAGHGFNCDQRASFDESSAELARARSLAFFERHLR